MISALAALVLAPNTLSRDERAAGWRLLFDGRSTRGWRNFRSSSVGKGWRVADGALVCADPRTAGDLVTTEAYDWFELRLEYRLSVGGNSGVLFHVAETGGATWESGPEIQLHDSRTSGESQKSGWLYGLYSTPTDASRPEGEWNRLRIVIAPGGCSTELNDVPYVLFRLGDEEFSRRVAASKFGAMPAFARIRRGAIALQGDHGVVAFRDVKIRPLRVAEAARSGTR